MVNKRTIIGVTLSVAVVGAVAAISLAASSDKSKLDPNLQMYTDTEKLGADGVIQTVKEGSGKDVAKMVSDYKKSTGKDLEVVEYQASDGQRYFLLVPPQLKDKAGQKMEKIEQQILANKLVKERLERTSADQTKVVADIQSLFGISGVAYEHVSGNPYTKTDVRERYSDGKGRDFTFDVASGKVVRLQVGGKNWCEANKDILDGDCHYKAGNLTEDQATEKASDFLAKALGDEKAKEVMGNISLQRISEKGNTFVFIYPEGAGTADNKDYQIMLVIEPVKGGIINYQNYLK